METVTIRVVEVERTLVDVTTTPTEEILAAFNSEQGKTLPHVRATARSVADMGEAFRGPYAAFLAPGAVAPATAQPHNEIQEVILLRTLLANPDVVPVIVPALRQRRGQPATKASTAASTKASTKASTATLQARMPTRIQGFDAETGRWVAVAAEEPFAVAGFAVATVSWLKGIFLAFHPGASTAGLGVASSGGYTAGMLASLLGLFATAAPTGGQHPRWLPKQYRFVPATMESAQALLQQSIADFSLTVSGATVARVGGLITAALRGEPHGALAELPAFRAADITTMLESTPVPRALPAPALPQLRPPEAQERLRLLIRRLARTELVASTDATGLESAPVADLFRVGALGVYLHMLVTGRDAPAVDDFFELSTIRFAKAQHAVERRGQLWASTNRARQYVSIVEDKFGSGRQETLLRWMQERSSSRPGAPGGQLAAVGNAVQVFDPELVLKGLTAAERQVVRAEYDARAEQARREASNRCPHLRVVARLRRATTGQEATRLLRELEAFLAPGDRAPSSTKAATKAGTKAKAAATAAPGWLHCELCRERALCPHVRDRIQMEAGRVPAAVQQERLEKYAVRVQTPGASAYANYCHVCSERFAEVDPEEAAEVESRTRYGHLDSGLRARVWVLALGAARKVVFAVPTDERVFANTVADLVYPHVEAAMQAAPRRRRVESLERGDEEDGGDIDPRTQLSAVVHVYAAVLDMIRATAGRRGGAIGFEGVRPGSKLTLYADRILTQIATSHRSLLAAVDTISADQLKLMFADAYRRVQGQAPIVGHAPEEELAVQTTTIDPVYKYAVRTARLVGAVTATTSAAHEFETALGASLPEIVAQARVAGKDPRFAPFLQRRAGIEVPQDVPLEFYVMRPELNLYARLYEAPPATAAEKHALAAAATAASETVPVSGVAWLGGGDDAMSADDTSADDTSADDTSEVETTPDEDASDWFVDGGKRQQPMKKKPAVVSKSPTPKSSTLTSPTPKSSTLTSPTPKSSTLAQRPPPDEPEVLRRAYVLESYRLLTRLVKTVTSERLRDEFQQDLGRVRAAEKHMRVRAVTRGLKPYWDAGHRGEATFQIRERVVSEAYGARYDLEGRPHDWAVNVIYIYAGAAGAVRVEGGARGVMRARADGRVAPEDRLVDAECPICGVLRSEAAKLDPEVVRANIQVNAEIDSFFLFYEARCPVGGLHAWGAEGSCSKCGRGAGRLAEAVRREYFRRYTDTYRHDRQLLQPVVAPAAPPAATAAAPPATLPDDDYSAVVAAAALAGVPTATVEAIGSMEGRMADEIARGESETPPVTSIADARIQVVDAEVRRFLRRYNQLRNIGRLASPPEDLAALAAEAATAAAAGQPAIAALTSYAPEYSRLRQALAQDPARLMRWVLQALCRVVVEVSLLGELGKKFATREFQAILRGQSLLSKPGEFNRGIFEASEDTIGDDTAADQPGDVGEDIVERTGEELPDNPYSGEGVDMDVSEDNPNLEP